MKRLALFSKVSFGFLLFAALTNSAHNAAARTPDGTDLLRAMTKAERAVSYAATETITQRGAPTIKARVWRQGTKRRIEFLEPPVRRGDLLIDDGTNVWLYHKSERAAVQTKSLGNVDVAGFDKEEKLATRVSGPTNYAGRRAWLVEIGNAKKKSKRRVWIDVATKVRLRADRLTQDGATNESRALQNVQFAAVPGARFAWTPPANTTVTRTSGKLFAQLTPAKRAADWLQYPRTVPAGYVFESAVVDNKKNEAWLRYTNGAQRFSIFQQRVEDPGTMGGITEPRRVDGGWYWQGSGSRLLSVGIPSTVSDQVIRSVR